MDNDTLSKLVDVYSNVINARACLDLPDSVRGYLNTAADLLNQIADAYDLSLPMDSPTGPMMSDKATSKISSPTS